MRIRCFNRPMMVVAVCTVLCSAASPLRAAPIDVAGVPADAIWVMHLDMDAARASTVVRRAYERMLTMHPYAATMVDMAAKMSGVDRGDPGGGRGSEHEVPGAAAGPVVPRGHGRARRWLVLPGPPHDGRAAGRDAG